MRARARGRRVRPGHPAPDRAARHLAPAARRHGLPHAGRAHRRRAHARARGARRGRVRSLRRPADLAEEVPEAAPIAAADARPSPRGGRRPARSMSVVPGAIVAPGSRTAQRDPDAPRAGAFFDQEVEAHPGLAADTRAGAFFDQEAQRLTAAEDAPRRRPRPPAARRAFGARGLIDRPAALAPTPSRPVVPVPGVFVTGTDTGVGKTILAAALVAAARRRGARVGAFKPVVTGIDDGPAAEQDDAILARAAGSAPAAVAATPLRPADVAAPRGGAGGPAPGAGAPRGRRIRRRARARPARRRGRRRAAGAAQRRRRPSGTSPARSRCRS